MKRQIVTGVACVFSAVTILALVGAVRADEPAESAESPKALLNRITPSLVAVRYTWAYEFGRIDFVIPGAVVRDDGLTMIPMAAVGAAIPDSQLVDLKIIVPSKTGDAEEVNAVFQGRDERTNMAFVKPAETGRSWKPVEFGEAPAEIGQTVTSIGMLPKDAGYGSYFARGIVGGFLRGEEPSILVTSGGLAAVGAPVFNSSGKAIGVVVVQPPQQVFLDTSNERQSRQINTLAAVNIPPCLFLPTAQFAGSLKDPPSPEKPVRLPWLGTPGLTGLDKNVAETFGLTNQPAVEIGDVIPGSPADKAGLKVGEKIIQLNGQPLERGDQPEELPMILARNIRRIPIGSEITLGVFTEKDKPLRDVKVTLEERPKRQNEMERFWAEDLGFSARDLVFEDTYNRKLPPDSKGVIVALIKREGSAAAAKLEMGDIISDLNGSPVVDLKNFRERYESLRKDRPREPIVLVVVKPDTTTQTIRIEPPQ